MPVKQRGQEQKKAVQASQWQRSSAGVWTDKNKKNIEDNINSRFQNILNFRMRPSIKQHNDDIKGRESGRLSTCKCLLVLNILIQFLLQMVIAILLYVSSKLSISIFCSLITFVALIHIVLALTFITNAKDPILTPAKINPSAVIQGAEINTPTVPNLRMIKPTGENQKTKKLKHSALKHRKKDSKIEAMGEMGQKDKMDEIQNQKSLENKQNPTKTFIFCKVGANIVALIIMGLILGLVIKPTQQGLSKQLILIILQCICTLFSFFLIYKLSRQFIPSQQVEATKQTDNKVLVIDVKEVRQEQRIYTSLSIDEYIEPIEFHPNREQTSKKTFKNINMIPSLKDLQNSKRQVVIAEDKPTLKETISQQIIPENILQELNKIQIKKSVLKNTLSVRSRNASMGGQVQFSEENISNYQERRKVEINFQQIQYFQYSRGSPANSIEPDSRSIASQKKEKGFLNKCQSKYRRQGKSRQMKEKKKEGEDKRRRSRSVALKERMEAQRQIEEMRSIKFK